MTFSLNFAYKHGISAALASTSEALTRAQLNSNSNHAHQANRWNRYEFLAQSCRYHLRTSMALGIGLYIIPLAMIANPGLIQFGSSPLGALYALVKVGLGLGLGMISYGVIAPMLWWVRLLLIVVGDLGLIKLKPSSLYHE